VLAVPLQGPPEAACTEQAGASAHLASWMAATSLWGTAAAAPMLRGRKPAPHSRGSIRLWSLCSQSANGLLPVQSKTLGVEVTNSGIFVQVLAGSAPEPRSVSLSSGLVDPLLTSALGGSRLMVPQPKEA